MILTFAPWGALGHGVGHAAGCLPAPTTAAAAATPTAAAAATVVAGTSFVDLEVAAAEVLAVQRGNSRLGFAIIGHFHEAEARGRPVSRSVIRVTCVT